MASNRILHHRRRRRSCLLNETPSPSRFNRSRSLSRNLSINPLFAFWTPSPESHRPPPVPRTLVMFSLSFSGQLIFFFFYDFCYQVLMEKNRTFYWYSNTGKNVHLFFNVGVNLSCKKTVEDWRRAWINQKGDFDTKLSMGKNWTNWNFDFKQLQLKNMWICCEWRRRWWQRRGWWWNWNFWNWDNED